MAADGLETEAGAAEGPRNIADLELEGEFWRSQEMSLVLFSIPKAAPPRARGLRNAPVWGSCCPARSRGRARSS